MSIFHWKQDFAASSGRCQNTRHHNFWQNWIGFKNLPASYYRDLQTSGQSMCSNGRLAIETSIKNLILSKKSCSPFYRCLLSQAYATPNRPGGLPVCALPPRSFRWAWHWWRRFLGHAQESRCTLLLMHTYFLTKNSARGLIFAHELATLFLFSSPSVICLDLHRYYDGV